ncbi:hypothetical protein CPB84DRAFT_1855089 [Gymnopilus junonius]|uniref:DUF6532 domain-containing protein n=1 Tax=Gymnopilus junonius TaxID=109634 RepID=A0A9P5N8P0_GYMJU|nr:hypothetical protein CPB84DRAFT_1855089 [Gymnopilus junonius]
MPHSGTANAQDEIHTSDASEANASATQALECPPRIRDQAHAYSIVEQALELREVFYSRKQDALARLQKALADAQIADTKLFNIEIHVGRLQHFITQSGFDIPPPVIKRRKLAVTTDGAAAMERSPPTNRASLSGTGMNIDPNMVVPQVAMVVAAGVMEARPWLGHGGAVSSHNQVNLEVRPGQIGGASVLTPDSTSNVQSHQMNGPPNITANSNKGMGGSVIKTLLHHHLDNLKRGPGQCLAAMETTSNLLGEGLQKLQRKRAGAFDNDSNQTGSQTVVPSSVPENSMAPPAPKHHKQTRQKPTLPPQPIQNTNILPGQSLNPFNHTSLHSAFAGQPFGTLYSVAGISSLPQGFSILYLSLSKCLLCAHSSQHSQQLSNMGHSMLNTHSYSSALPGNSEEHPTRQPSEPGVPRGQPNGHNRHMFNDMNDLPAPTQEQRSEFQPQGRLIENTDKWSDINLGVLKIHPESKSNLGNENFQIHAGQSADSMINFDNDVYNDQYYDLGDVMDYLPFDRDADIEEEGSQGGNEDPGDEDLGDNEQEIDETSPSEDERAAEAVIRHSGHASQAADKDNNYTSVNPGQDVLQEHRQCNRAVHPPQEQHLFAMAEHQLGWPSVHMPVDNHNNTAEGEGEDQNAESQTREEQARKNRPRKKKVTRILVSDPSPVPWRRGDPRILTTIMGLGRPPSLREAGYVLTCVILEHKAKGTMFSDEFEQTRDMNVVVFQEASTYCGRLKTACVELVKRHYKHYFFPDCNIDNQEQLQAVITDNVEHLLDDSNEYHQNGKDREGCTNNLAHPCIRDLCIEFYYGLGKDSLARQHPEAFSTTIPEYAVAIAITCIEEYRPGYRVKRDFNGKGYQDVLDGVLEVIKEVKNDEYHNAKWEENLRRWAHDGMKLLNPIKTVRLQKTTRVVLD